MLSDGDVTADLAEHVGSALDETFRNRGNTCGDGDGVRRGDGAVCSATETCAHHAKLESSQRGGSLTAASSAFQIIPYATDAVDTFVVIFEAGVW